MMIRKGLAITAVCAALALMGCGTAQSPPAQAFGPSESLDNVFRGTKAEVIHLAIKAIQAKGWKLDQVNENVGIVSFQTGISMGSWSGISANLILEEAGPGAFRVTGTAKQNLQGGQIAAFDIGGEAQRAVNEAIATMRSIERA